MTRLLRHPALPSQRRASHAGASLLLRSGMVSFLFPYACGPP